MMSQTLKQIFQRLIKPGPLTLVSRSIEIFGCIDLLLGLLILIAPRFTAALFHVPPLSPPGAGLLRVVGVLVTTLGLLYIINGRFNSLGFAVGSLLDRPLVPLIMAVLWHRHILPGPLAASFSIVDFSGFLATAFAWRADLLSGRNIGGPGLPAQTRAARAAEVFGWLTLAIGFVTLLFPGFTASLLEIPSDAFSPGANYLQLAGLLVGGLGMLFVVGGSLDTGGFVTASVSVQLIAALLVALAWWSIPRCMALAFIGVCLAGAFATLLAAAADLRSGNQGQRVPLIAQWVSAWFAFLSGVVRNARVFHPDGRVFLGTVRQLPEERTAADAAGDLSGFVMMRIGMGVMKRGMPVWLANLIPDAPSIASRFFTASEGGSGSPAALRLSQIPLQFLPGRDFDLLSTAGGDRLWKLVWNLATGGNKYGLKRFDYFANSYYADVPYRIAAIGGAVWIRLQPKTPTAIDPSGSEGNATAREQALTDACAAHALVFIEVQPVDSPTAPFEPIATIQFEREIEIDQEALHFYPYSGRGFEPYGFFTGLRRSVYPASVQGRPHDRLQRTQREPHPFRRLVHYWNEIPTGPIVIEGGSTAVVPPYQPEIPPCGSRRWVRVAVLAVIIVAVTSGFYLVERFTRDRPVDYTDEVAFFERGSTGGERMDGIPYWVWITLPEIFSDQLPDQRTGQGYAAFGMIYEPKDQGNPYALPLGMSRRNVSGLDVVYLNCAACHTGTVRDTPGAEPHIYPGMPAHQFDLGAWGRFLTTIPKDQRFSPQRILDQIDRMQDDKRRLVAKPDLINRLILRYYAIYLMRDKLIILGQRLSFIDNSTWGPGRVDTFNAPKALLNFPMEHADPKELMGNADFPSVWNQQARKGMHLHWDGNNTSVDERNLSAAFGTGAYPPILDSARVLRMAKYLETAQPPPYPYPIDHALADKGKPVYEQYCVGCHGTREPPFRTTTVGDNENCDYKAPGTQCVGTVVPLGEIGTDPYRFNSYTWLLAVNQSTLYAGYEKDWGFKPSYPQRFHLFRKTHGYASMPLDGIWLRAPYLHNGSVPTLNDLLKPSSARTRMFFRGNDVFDRDNVGFVSNVPQQNGRNFFPFDTAKPGNGNQGHEGDLYGTNLDPDRKRALLEYLKTF